MGTGTNELHTGGQRVRKKKVFLFFRVKNIKRCANNAKNAGDGISKYARLCSNQIPCTLLAQKQYPVSFHFSLNQFFSAALKQNLRSSLCCHW